MMPTFQNVAQTSNYLVQFGLPSFGGLRGFLRKKGIDYRFHNNTIGLLCSSAFLPGSAFAPEVVTGEYQGVVETIPHTRNFTRIKLEFYVDNEYKSLKFLEHWMEYISGATSRVSPLDDAYYFRFNYPEEYRSNQTKIIKFEKNYRQFLEYTFKGLFPLALDSTRVQYQESKVLKATCSFAYERYICGEASSASDRRGTSMNNQSQAASRFGRSIDFGSAQDALNSGAPTTNEVDKQVNKVKTITGQDGFKYEFGSKIDDTFGHEIRTFK